MYIIEKLIKIYNKLKHSEKGITIPCGENETELEDVLTCNHTFLPVDSTGETFACTKCGYLVSKDRLKINKDSV